MNHHRYVVPCSFKLSVTATADNCLMTCYPFLAQHRTDHQIVVEQGNILKGRRSGSQESEHVGEAVLRRCVTPSRPSSRPSTTATSSNFEISSSSYEDSNEVESGNLKKYFLLNFSSIKGTFVMALIKKSLI